MTEKRIVTVVKRLCKVKEKANEILRSIKPEDFDSPQAVNYADLSCIQAEQAVDDDGNVFTRIIIAEASPEAWEFGVRVKNLMQEAGYCVYVVTEW